MKNSASERVRWIETIMGSYSGFTCEQCGWETPRAIYREGKRLCPDCHGTEDRSAGVRHQSYLDRRKFKYMSHAEAQQIMTNRKREDGQYRPDKQWR